MSSRPQGYDALYNERIADLLRIATGGSGVLPAGEIHPDLANRLAIEAAQTAEEVLRICIRAMDYVPPVDITFGKFLRALITADYELAPTERRHTRIAFIEAFRSWGIYPRDVSTLSEESLRWLGPTAGAALTNLQDIPNFERSVRGTLAGLAQALEAWRPGNDRASVFAHILRAQAAIHSLLQRKADKEKGRAVLPGLDLRTDAEYKFSVANLRPARRIGQLGDFRTEMVVEVVQTARPADPTQAGDGVPVRGGATLIVDLRTWEVRYVIYKRLYDRLPNGPGVPGRIANRLLRQQRDRARLGILGFEGQTWQGEADADLGAWLSATYDALPFAGSRRARQIQQEPFALLHRNVR